MSAIAGLIISAIIARVVIPTGSFVVGKCLEGMSKGLSSEGQNAFKNSCQQLNNEIDALKPISQIRSEFKPISTQILQTGSLEEAKGKILAEIAGQSYVGNDTAKIKRYVSALQNANSFDELEKTRKNLSDTIEDNHQQLFSGALLKACQTASVKIGFAKLESLPSALSSAVRFAATDNQGRTLITEINAPKNRQVKVQTETVGIMDGSCQDILDAFQKALEAEGVKSQPTTRKFTGGVCEMSAVKDFINQKLIPKPINKAIRPASVKDTKRSQRLNQKTQTQKQ